MKLTIPELSFVVLIGVSGSGKSTFARKHFKPTEILSSDYCRGLVSDDENSQAATKDAFELLHFIARKRLAAGKLTVVDATNVQPESRKPLVEIAREFHCLPVAIVQKRSLTFDMQACRALSARKNTWVRVPWSAKAQELLKQQYAAVGASAQATLADEVTALEQAAERGPDVSGLLTHTAARRQMVSDYLEAYRRYCWPVNSVNDLKLAPFHLLASEGKVHTDKPNDWHMQTLARLAGGIIIATPFRIIDVTNPESEAEGILWWEELTGRGGEGMVVKPLEFIAKSRRGLVQPAVKCRGREYLRIIYGPEYTAPENLDRLRARGLSTKRSLALREFALGIESLERFVRKEPLRRVHEAVFGVLALESEPVDPRL